LRLSTPNNVYDDDDDDDDDDVRRQSDRQSHTHEQTPQIQYLLHTQMRPVS